MTGNGLGRCYRTFRGGFEWKANAGNTLGSATLVKTWCAKKRRKKITWAPRPHWDTNITLWGRLAGYEVDGFDHLVHTFVGSGLRRHVSAETIEIVANFLWIGRHDAFTEREGWLVNYKGESLDGDSY